MAISDSDGAAAAVLLADWMSQLLGGSRHRPITAEDLVFRDLHALIAGHPGTLDALADLTEAITRTGDAPAGAVVTLAATVDGVAGRDREFGPALGELVRVLRPLLPDDPPVGKHWNTGAGPRGLDEREPTTGPRVAPLEPFDGGLEPDTAIPVTVHLSAAAGSERVEAAVELLLASAGVQITERGEPVYDSWSRHMVARSAGSAAGHDAAVTAHLMQNLGPTIAALQDYDEAVVRVGALLMVKLGPLLVVRQLHPAERGRLDQRPELCRSPREVLTAVEVRLV